MSLAHTLNIANEPHVFSFLVTGRSALSSSLITVSLVGCMPIP
ncbi:hypothetical protein MRBBS_0846 [Marinobacter sp. BSs20148]|nr:hypothetical protein MRBBS_0846 [Marinobacter sp. BSs20148]